MRTAKSPRSGRPKSVRRLDCLFSLFGVCGAWRSDSSERPSEAGVETRLRRIDEVSHHPHERFRSGELLVGGLVAEEVGAGGRRRLRRSRRARARRSRCPGTPVRRRTRSGRAWRRRTPRRRRRVGALPGERVGGERLPLEDRAERHVGDGQRVDSVAGGAVAVGAVVDQARLGAVERRAPRAGSRRCRRGRRPRARQRGATGTARAAARPRRWSASRTPGTRSPRRRSARRRPP